jgi:hypothetical protein
MSKEIVSAMLGELDKLSGGKLHFRDDIEKLIEIAVSESQLDLLNRIAFDAKFLSSILKLIQRRDVSMKEEYFIIAQGEYEAKLQNIQSLLKELITYGSDFYKTIFNEKFLLLNRQAFANLNFLFEDLSFLKLYINDKRHEERTI